MAKRLLYLLWFYCDMVLVIRLLAFLSGGRLPVDTPDWRNAVLLVAALALTAACIYPVRKRLAKGRAYRLAAGLMAGAGYWFTLYAAFGPFMLYAALPIAAAGAYLTVYGLKKPEWYES